MSRQFNIRVTEASSGAAGALFWLLVIIMLIGGAYIYKNHNTNTSDNIARLRHLVSDK